MPNLLWSPNAWNQELEKELSYLRLLSRENSLTPRTRERKEELEMQYCYLGVGKFPGSVVLLRELYRRFPDFSQMTEEQYKERTTKHTEIEAEGSETHECIETDLFD